MGVDNFDMMWVDGEAGVTEYIPVGEWRVRNAYGGWCAELNDEYISTDGKFAKSFIECAYLETFDDIVKLIKQFKAI